MGCDDHGVYLTADEAKAFQRKRMKGENNMLGHDEDIALLTKYKQALESISALWPEPPHCADIYQVSGINDGRMRALAAGAAIEIARKALGKPFTPHPDDRRQWNLECLLCGHRDTNLVAMQEHGMADHGMKREQFWKQTREPQKLDATEYVFSLPDGVQWLKASSSTE